MATSEKAPKRKCAFPSCEQPGSKACGGCKEVGYCSKEHQRDDWPNHKLVCKKAHQPAQGSQPSTSDSTLTNLPKRPLEDVTVLWDDQKRINLFGRLNQRHIELVEVIKAKKMRRENLVDAVDALDEPDSDDEDSIKMQVGEVFVASKKGAAQDHVKAEIAKVEVELKDARAQKAEIVKEMADLKAHLKAKFKDSINLDYELEDPDEHDIVGSSAVASNDNGSKKENAKPTASPAKSAQPKQAAKKPSKKKDSDSDDD
jgi:prefoldin subunit 4